jgi:hypothetical protein
MRYQNNKHCRQKVEARRQNHFIDVDLNHKIPTKVSETNQVQNQGENQIENIK